MSHYKLQRLIGTNNKSNPLESEVESELSEHGENGQPNGNHPKPVRRSLRLTVHSDDDSAAHESDANDSNGSGPHVQSKNLDIFSLQRNSNSRHHLQSSHHDQGPQELVDSRRHSARLIKRQQYEASSSRPFYLDELEGSDEEDRDDFGEDYRYEERSLTAYQRYNLRDRKRSSPFSQPNKGFDYVSRDRRPSSRYNLRPHRGTRAIESYQVPWSVAEQYAFAEKPNRSIHIPDKALMEATPELQPYERHVESASGNLDDGTSIMNDEEEIIAQNIESTLSESPFLRIAGMADYVKQLKEMVVFPLLYPSFFSRLGISPPRGVLFYGPPGTGKTLMARLLAESCSSSTRKVSFFMRNGSDCLSKWIGEAERNMKLLFQKAKECQPSIIFFDEIDGLAPERSARADQSHISLVSTLLALMDGLDDRGNVVVIGATNRIQALDPALRRPGRFDREFCFGLPDESTRFEILNIQTKSWEPKPEAGFLSTLARMTFGFSGADLRGLCTEAALHAIRRIVPEAYESASVALEAHFSDRVIVVTDQDFHQAFRKMIPSTRRHEMTDPPTIPMPYSLLFTDILEQMIEAIKGILGSQIPCDDPSLYGDSQWLFETNCVSFNCKISPSISQKLLKMACSQIQGFKQIFINVDKLANDGSSIFNELLMGPFRDAKLYAPSIVIVPDLSGHEFADSILKTITRFVSSFMPSDAILVIGFNLESSVDVVDLPTPSDDAIRSFFDYVIVKEVKTIITQKLANIDVILKYGLEMGVDWQSELLVSPFPDYDVFTSSISILPNYSTISTLIQPLMVLGIDDFYRQFIPTGLDLLINNGGDDVDILYHVHNQRLKIIRNIQLIDVPTVERVGAVFQMVFNATIK